MKPYNILLVEDDFTALQFLKRILTSENYTVIGVDNADDALAVLKRERIDLIITDWMMPNIDGIEFIYRIKALIKNPPPIIVVSALSAEMAKDYALKTGAVEFIEKPINTKKFLEIVNQTIVENIQITQIYETKEHFYVPFIPVAILAGNGSSQPLLQIFRDLVDLNENIVYTVVFQGGVNLLNSVVKQLRENSSKNVIIVQSTSKPERNCIYFAPDDYHILFNNNYEIVVDSGPKENYLRPSAEPLLRSLANHFGKYSIVVILSGMGTDGLQAAYQIKSHNGTIICQDPSTALAPTLPKSFINSKIETFIALPNQIGKKIKDVTEKLLFEISRKKI